MTTHEPISVTNQLISVEGKVFYNDSRRRIELKKPIRDLFSKQGLDVSVRYVMELCLSQEKALKRVKELSESNVLPVLMYFVVEEGESS